MKRDNYLRRIIASAEDYLSLLMDKAILFVYRNETGFDFIEIKFKKENFKQLLGISTKIKAADFFDNCINHNLALNSYRPSIFTPLKLLVFDALVHLPENLLFIGESDGNVYLQVDSVTEKNQMALSLSKKRGKFYFPSALLNEGKNNNFITHQNPILLTFIRKIDSDKSKYCLSYVNEKCDVNKVISELPENIKAICQLI